MRRSSLYASWVFNSFWFTCGNFLPSKVPSLILLFYSFTQQWKLEESAVQVLIRPGNCNFKVVHFIFRACSFFYCASQQLSPLCYFNDNVQTATPRSSATHLTSSPSIQEQSILTILWSSLAFSWPCVRLFATMCDKLTTLLVTPFRIFWLLYGL